LKRIIEEIEMKNDVERMKRYFSQEAWVKQRPRYEHGPSTEWQSIYREANALLGEDPGSDAALALAGRWLEQLDRDTGGDSAVLIGRTLAWEDREHWPDALKRELTEYKLESAYQFFSKAMLAHRKRFASDDLWIRRDPRAQASVPWYQIFLEPRIALALEPAFPGSERVRTQWLDFIHRSTRVDPEVQARSVRAQEEALEKHQTMWRALADDARASAGEKPGGPIGQELALRWIDLWDTFLKGDVGVQAALRKAPAVAEIFRREDVTDFLGACLAWPLQRYFSTAAWSGLEERSRRLPLASVQQSARAQIALFRDAEAAVGNSPKDAAAQALAVRARALACHDAGGNLEIEAGIRNAWQHRGQWPPRFREHAAALYLTDMESFETAANFLDYSSDSVRP
jgi:hypothetical protein